MNEREKQIGFTCPPRLRREFRRACKKAGYTTTSEALRALMRDFICRVSPPGAGSLPQSTCPGTLYRSEKVKRQKQAYQAAAAKIDADADTADLQSDIDDLRNGL